MLELKHILKINPLIAEGEIIKTLVLTPIFGFPDKSDDEVVFLGAWCQEFSKKNIWENLNYYVIPNHWDDREKVANDYKYLGELHERLLTYLLNLLNHHHGVDQNERYWRTILDPWLVNYISVFFDRWECLSNAFRYCEAYSITTSAAARQINTPIDFISFQKDSLEDDWNETIFMQIINYAYKDKCNFHLLSENNLSIKEGKRNEGVGYRKSNRRRIGEFIDKVLGFISKDSRIIFFESYIPLLALIKISLKLKIVPRLYFSEFSFYPKSLRDAKVDIELRSKLREFKNYTNKFEQFLSSRILMDLPVSYFEGYHDIVKKVNEIPLKPQVIMSAIGHWHNDLFKFWVAKNVSSGAKYVAIQHGGSINIGTMVAMDFEERISDFYATPSTSCYLNHYQLPFVKSLNKAMTCEGDSCSLIGYDGQRYVFRLEATPLSGQCLEGYDQSIDFYDNLRSDIKSHFHVRPHPGQGWETAKRYAHDIGKNKLSERGSFDEFIKTSKVIICTYPNTTFAEAMISGIPTILLYPEHLWELNVSQNKLLEILKLASIVFNDPIVAANHINSIWENPGDWWNQGAVKLARDKFFKEVMYTSNSSIDEWVDFIKKIDKHELNRS